MGRLYTANFKAVAATVQQDFFELLAGTNKPIKVHAWQLAQSTEIGDAMEEGLVVACKRGVGSTTGSGGTAPTATPVSVDDTAAGATVEVNNTTKMSAGTITVLEAHVWNVRVPYMMVYTPEMRPYIKPGDRWTLELETTPADSITLSGTIWFEELG
jgi:hypothetical protein